MFYNNFKLLSFRVGCFNSIDVALNFILIILESLNASLIVLMLFILFCKYNDSFCSMPYLLNKFGF